jgi:hypothetical protein
MEPKGLLKGRPRPAGVTAGGLPAVASSDPPKPDSAPERGLKAQQVHWNYGQCPTDGGSGSPPTRTIGCKDGHL